MPVQNIVYQAAWAYCAVYLCQILLWCCLDVILACKSTPACAADHSPSVHHWLTATRSGRVVLPLLSAYIHREHCHSICAYLETEVQNGSKQLLDSTLQAPLLEKASQTEESDQAAAVMPTEDVSVTAAAPGTGAESAAIPPQVKHCRACQTALTLVEAAQCIAEPSEKWRKIAQRNTCHHQDCGSCLLSCICTVMAASFLLAFLMAVDGMRHWGSVTGYFALSAKWILLEASLIQAMCPDCIRAKDEVHGCLQTTVMLTTMCAHGQESAQKSDDEAVTVKASTTGLAIKADCRLQGPHAAPAAVAALDPNQASSSFGSCHFGLCPQLAKQPVIDCASLHPWPSA